MSIHNILTGLHDADVHFVVVGMVAGQIHGSRQLTEDIDIVYDPSPENMATLVRYLSAINAYIQELWPQEGFASPLSLERLQVAESLTLGSDEGEIDLLHRIDGVGSYQNVLDASQTASIADRDILVLSVEAVIASKRASNRQKDLLHLPELEAIVEIRNAQRREREGPTR